MNRNEVMDLINEIEEKFPVDEWAVDGIHVWPLIRISLAMRMYAQNASFRNKKSKEDEKSIFQHIRRANIYLRGWAMQYRAFLLDRVASDKIVGPVDVLILTYSTCRRFVNQKWFDQIFDPVRDKVDVKFTTFEMAPQYEYRFPRYNSSIYIQNSIDIIKIINKLSIKSPRAYKLPLYGEVNKKLVENIGFGLPSNSQLFKSVNLINRLSYFWEKKLKATTPNLVLTQCYYSDIGMALNLACSRLKITSVDIQHGVQGDYHIAYGRWNCVPKNGYELLPNLFWCWSEDEKQSIDKWNKQCTRSHKAVIAGNWWLNIWHDNNNKIVKDYNEIIYPMMTKETGQINILYTLQPIYDPPEWFIEYIRHSPPNWKWWIRLHQGMQAEIGRITKLFSTCDLSKIDINNATTMPLPALLNHMNVHITVNSSVVIEASEFAVPSIILSQNGELMYSDYISSGHAKYIDNKKDLDAAICYFCNSNINASRKPKINFDSDKFLYRYLRNKNH